MNLIHLSLLKPAAPKLHFFSCVTSFMNAPHRNLASSIKKPFELRYNPYTQSVEALSTSGKIMDIAKELRGDMFLIANAIKKIQVHLLTV